MQDLVTALALILVLEGVAYAAFPERMKRMVVHILALPPQTIRTAGLISAALGTLLVWLVRTAANAP